MTSGYPVLGAVAGAGTSNVWQTDGTDIWYTAGNVGIGTNAPDGTLHVHTATAGVVAASVDADDLVIESSGDMGITLLSGVTSHCNIFFGDSGSNAIGRIRYSNTDNDLSFWTNNAERVTIDSSGNVGIGTTAPDGTMHVHTATAGTVTANTAADDLVVENSGDGGISILTPNTSTASIRFGDTEDNDRGYIAYDHNVDETFFVSNATETMRLQSSNNVSIGSTNNSGQLYVRQPGSSAAEPVLHLDQVDMSEEFIRLTGQSAAATLTQSFVASGDVSTFTPTGYLKINIQDEGNQIADGAYYIQFGTIS